MVLHVSNVTSAGNICTINNVIAAMKEKIVYIITVKKIPKMHTIWNRWFFFLLLDFQEGNVEQ